MKHYCTFCEAEIYFSGKVCECWQCGTHNKHNITARKKASFRVRLAIAKDLAKPNRETYRAIGTRYGYSEKAVHDIACKVFVPEDVFKLSDYQRKVWELYEKLKEVKAVADAIGCDDNTMRRHIKKIKFLKEQEQCYLD
jgi:hypothetical protein